MINLILKLYLIIVILTLQWKVATPVGLARTESPTGTQMERRLRTPRRVATSS